MPVSSINIPSYELLDAPIHALTMTDLNDIIGGAGCGGRRIVIAHQNLHGVYLYHTDPTLRAFYRSADYIHVDGMALVAVGRLTGLPLERKHRTTYVDWIRPLMQIAARCRLRVFFVGSKPGVALRAKDRLCQEFPDLHLEVMHGYFNPHAGSPDGEAVIAKIKEYQPHILMVGMGMPRQEHWIHEHLQRLQANVILPCGACMDYIAGAIPIAPRWMGRMGLEWAFRLFTEPTRLWRRYLVEPWVIARLILRYWWNRRSR